MNEFEVKILLWIQEHRVPALDFFNKYITVLEEWGLLSIIVCVLLLLFRKTRKYGLPCSLSLLLEFILNNGFLKIVINRARPYAVDPSVADTALVLHFSSDASFPSGHTGAAFAVAWAMLLVMPKKWGVPAVILAALISLSRLYVGVHYPTDVLGAAALGIITSYIARAISEKLMKNEKVRKLI